MPLLHSLLRGKPDHTILIPRAHEIKQFQRYHGVPVTGVIDHATRRKMRQVNTTVATGALSYGGPH